MDQSKGFFAALVLVLLAVSAMLVLPYLQYFLLAVVLAYALTPVQKRLERHIPPGYAAAVVVTATAVALLIPLAVVSRVVVTEASTIVEGIREGDITLEGLEQTIERSVGTSVDLTGSLRSAFADGASGGGVDSVLGIFGLVTHAALGLGLTLFLLYYFLKDGDNFMAWLREVVPLSDDVQDDLYEAIDGITWAVLAGHIFVALVQGTLAGLGLLATGIPSVVFWTAIMIVLSLLPVVGSFLVWGPAAAYLLATNRPVAGALLFLYGAIIVGVSDDYLRPVVVDRYAEVSPAVIIIGVLGGLSAIGFVGIFVGPIVIGALRETLEVYRDQYHSVPGG